MKSLSIKFLVVAAVLGLSACGKVDPSAKVDASMSNTLYPLTAEERQLAETNAKQFYNKQWPAKGGELKTGLWTECRPSDSNTNGLVTCFGFVPSQTKDTMDVVTRYCGYRPKMVGCSDVDTVKQ